MVAGRHSVPGVRVRRPAAVGRGPAGATRSRVGAGELFEIIGVFNDVLINRTANEVVADLHPGQDPLDRATIPRRPRSLCPTDHPFATKRPCLDTNYFATFNLPHVRLVDLRKHPIATITESGIDTVDEHSSSTPSCTPPVSTR